MLSPTFYADCRAKVASITYEDLVRGCKAVAKAGLCNTDKERSRRYRERHPERVREKERRFWARHKDDPEFIEKHRAYNREWKRAKKDDPLFKASKLKSAKDHRARFFEKHGFVKSTYYTWKKKGIYMTEDIKSTKSNSTYSVQGTKERAYLIVTGEAATKSKVMKEVDRIRTGGATFAEAKWTAKMLARTF